MALLGLHELYLSALNQPSSHEGRRDTAVAVFLFSTQLFISLNKDATVVWAKRHPWSSPAPWSPIPQPSATLLPRP